VSRKNAILRVLILVVMISGSTLNVVCAGLFGSSNYDECILDNIKSVKSDHAVKLVVAACRSKFPVNINSNYVKELTNSVVAKIEGKSNILNESIAKYENKEWKPKSIENISGDIFNSNNDWYIKSIVVRIRDEDTNKYRDYDVAVKDKNGNSEISPLSSGEFTFEAYSVNKNWSWDIVGGRGYEK
jgi:hypothetical protein